MKNYQGQRKQHVKPRGQSTPPSDGWVPGTQTDTGLGVGSLLER